MLFRLIQTMKLYWV